LSQEWKSLQDAIAEDRMIMTEKNYKLAVLKEALEREKQKVKHYWKE